MVPVDHDCIGQSKAKTNKKNLQVAVGTMMDRHEIKQLACAVHGVNLR
jgi:hypothetical protein